MGIKNLSTFNKALLCKWNWPFKIERDALWNQLLRVKYGEEKGGWCTKGVRASYGVGVWKVIRKGQDSMVGKIAIEVGDGSRVKFWNDKWCGSVPLCDVFPTLFVVTTNKEALIKALFLKTV